MFVQSATPGVSLLFPPPFAFEDISTGSRHLVYPQLGRRLLRIYPKMGLEARNECCKRRRHGLHGCAESLAVAIDKWLPNPATGQQPVTFH